MPRAWKRLSKELKYKALIFRHHQVKAISPDTQKSGDFDIVECLNWANVIALDKKGQIIMVEQYRHGSDEVTLEIPGGAIGPHEDPLLAAKRELAEETGYTSTEWREIGHVDPNPAFMSNWCKTYLALNCEKTTSQNLDPYEEIDVVLKQKEELSQLVRLGKIKHSLVIAAFYFFEKISDSF